LRYANSRFSTLFEEEGHRSLLDCAQSHDESGKPIIRFSIAVANIGNGQLYLVFGEP
jgi:hypothetical protein